MRLLDRRTEAASALILRRLVASAPRRRLGGWFEVASEDRSDAEDLATQKLIWFDVLLDGDTWARLTLRGRWRAAFGG